MPSQQSGCGVLAFPGWRSDVHPRLAEPAIAYATRLSNLYAKHPLFSVIYLLEAHMSTMGGFVKQELDPPFDRALREMEREGVLFRTILLIAADHGLHFGPHLGPFLSNLALTFFCQRRMKVRLSTSFRRSTLSCLAGGSISGLLQVLFLLLVCSPCKFYSFMLRGGPSTQSRRARHRL